MKNQNEKPGVVKRCDDIPDNAPLMRMKRGVHYQKLKYIDPLEILIRFERTTRQRAQKLMNREEKSFTDIVNAALIALLDAEEIPKVEEQTNPFPND